MKKFYALLLAVLAFAGNVNAEEKTVTFDYTSMENCQARGIMEDYADITIDTIGDVTITWGRGDNANRPMLISEIRAGVVMADGQVFTASTAQGCIKKIALTLSALDTRAYTPSATDMRVSPGTYDFGQQSWSGNASAVFFKNIYVLGEDEYSHRFTVSSIEVTYDDAATDGDLPTVNSIAEFKGLGEGVTAMLHLNNAQCYIKSKKNTYIGDATGGIYLYRTNLPIATNDMLNGTLKATFSTTMDGLPQIDQNAAEAQSDFTVTAGEDAVPDTITARNFDKHLCQLVTLTGLQLKKTDYDFYFEYTDYEGNVTNYYLNFVSFASAGLMFDEPTEYEGKTFTATGIASINFYNMASNYGLELTEPIVDESSSAIETINADAAARHDNVRYNVYGQVVDENYKGIVIMNGKKFIQR